MPADSVEGYPQSGIIFNEYDGGCSYGVTTDTRIYRISTVPVDFIGDGQEGWTSQMEGAYEYYKWLEGKVDEITYIPLTSFCPTTCSYINYKNTDTMTRFRHQNCAWNSCGTGRTPTEKMGEHEIIMPIPHMLNGDCCTRLGERKNLLRCIMISKATVLECRVTNACDRIHPGNIKEHGCRTP